MGRRLIIAALLLNWAALSSVVAEDLWSLESDAPDTGSQAASLNGGNGDVAMTLANDCCCCQRCGWFAGGDYRLVRTHFSEATAFATLTAGVGPAGPNLNVVGHDIRFDYKSAFSVFGGYHLNDYSDLKFTYFHLDSQATLNDASAAPNQVIVDPVGNLAPFGSSINTSATVRLNVFDLEYLRRIEDPTWPASTQFSAGIRFANINQFFDATIPGVSSAQFRMNWSGVGPYTSILGRVYGSQRRFSAFAKGGGALLVGKNDIVQDVSATGAFRVPPAFPFTAQQNAGRILVVPVLEAELGASWQPNDRWRFSAGWFVQAWFDMGISGASFSGANLPAVFGPGFPAPANVFTEADDSSIMAFDGFFLRAELNY